MSTWLRIRCREVLKRSVFSRTRKQLLARGLTPGFFAYNVNTTGYHEATTNVPTVSNLKTALTSFHEVTATRQLDFEIIRPFHTEVRRTFQAHINLAYRYPCVRSHQMQRIRPMSTLRRRSFGSTFRVERIPLLARRHQHLRLLLRSYSNMPHLPHRPTKAEVLAQARGFFERFRVRVRFILMKSMRPWTLNDIGAVFSWVFLGQTVWLLVGTTSFVSLILWTANSLQFQEWIAYRIGQYLTSATGATVTFDSAIVPNWKEGKITLKNVRISRMPRSEQAKFERKTRFMEEDEYKLHTSAGSPISTGALESIALLTNSTGPDSFDDHPLAGVQFDEDENNNEVLKKWMWFDLTIESIQVTLNLVRWLDGKGLVQDADVQGVRGVVDRRHVRWDPNVPWDPAAARQKYTPGDFELEKLTIDDLLVTVYQPYGFRPYPVSIFSAELNQFRKQWLFYDILCATSIVGSFDKCLFSVHTPQLEKSVLEQSSHIDSQSRFRSHDIYHYYPRPDPNGVVVGDENEGFGIINEHAMEERGYKRMSRLRIDGVNTDHIFRRVEGPPGWISSGQVDVSADIYIPKQATTADSTELLRKLVYEIADKIELPQPVVLGTGHGDDEIVIGAHKSEEEQKPKQTVEPQFVMDIDFRFKNTKANIPLQTPELSYVSNAMVRPIVAYINRNKTIVPIKCRVVLPLSNFDGSWTAYDSMLMDSISEQLGKGFVDLTVDQQERNRRLKRIGFWSLQEIVRNFVALHEVMKGTSRGFWSFLGTGYAT